MFMFILLFLAVIAGFFGMLSWQQGNTARQQVALVLCVLVFLLSLGAIFLTTDPGARLLAVLLTVGALALGLALLLQALNR